MVEAGGFTPLSFGTYEEEVDGLDKRISPGQYDVRLAKWEFTESNKKGTPGIYFELRVINAEDPVWNNWPLHHRAWWTGSAWAVKDACLGLGGKKMADITLIPEEVRDGSSPELNDLLNAEGRVVVEEEEYEGKKQTRVARFVHRK
tara:strand:+ start:5678 stop:6115 length:438 start_codon:yes stop_codon:yes gene_type:complete